MESLGQLNGALPPPQGEDLQKAFRHAALSITTMYQASKKASANAYLTGKKEALQDVLEFLQASLDHPQPTSSASVSRLIDYICARQEALKAEEEDNEDDSESPPPPQRPSSAAPAPPSPHRPGPFQHRASTPSTSTLSATNSAPLSRSNSYQPRPTPAPVASTSSAPASPSFTPTSSHHNTLHRPNPFPFPPGQPSTQTISVPASPLSSSTTVNLPLSPLGRSSSSHHHHARSLRSRTSSRGKGTSNSTPGSGQATPISLGPSPIGGLEAAELVGGGGGTDGLALGMKRRWGIQSSGEVVEVAIDDDEADQENPEREDAGGDGMEMEMEGWDGVGERPFKRVARNFRREQEEDEGGQGRGRGEGENR
ncbi:hypothetical protein JCM5353_001310 [Sporobolomyces roseus]